MVLSKKFEGPWMKLAVLQPTPPTSWRAPHVHVSLTSMINRAQPSLFVKLSLNPSSQRFTLFLNRKQLVHLAHQPAPAAESA